MEQKNNGTAVVNGGGDGPNQWPEKMKLSKARLFLGISMSKMTLLISKGIIKYEQDPLDQRVKLVKRSDLEELQRQRTGS
ncbi:MAG: hypothetical protein ACJ74Q_15860 [Pyrinomonadaceae bacterium]